MKTLLLTAILLFSINTYSQTYSQYFDGDDTVTFIPVEFQSPLSSNIWQIGSPQKAIFDTAASLPNVIMTDTINFYPDNDTSVFIAKVATQFSWGLFAFQWMQKLDMDTLYDGGKIEFSQDLGQSWQNVFDNPYVYNYYGFDTSNVDTMVNNDIVFSGVDTTWKNIWLCYDMTWASLIDTMYIKFTFYSDGVNNNREGWMLDNFLGHFTQVHTVNEHKQQKSIEVYPNPAKDRINIQVKRKNKFQIIESIELFDNRGNLVKSFEKVPIKFFVDISDLAKGTYIIKVKATDHQTTQKIIHY